MDAREHTKAAERIRPHCLTVSSSLRATGTWRRRLAAGFCACVVAWLPARIHAAQPTALSRLVPADARVYLEVRDTSSILASPAGSLLAELLGDVAAPAKSSAPATQGSTTTRPATSRPAASDWRDRIARDMGLTQPGALDVLAGGRIALVADGWDSLNEAVLLAEPADVAALERLLAPAPLATATASAPVTSRAAQSQPQIVRLPATRPAALSQATGEIRRYPLRRGHELATDGHYVLVGRQARGDDLYDRTLALWSSAHGVCLADTIEFRDRLAPLPADPHVLLYATGRSRTGGAPALPMLFWPSDWGRYQAVASAVTLTPTGITIDSSGYPSRDTATPGRGAPGLLTRLPASTLIAWTHPIDYADQYRRTAALEKESLFTFYREVLETGLQPGSLERDLLSRLSTETLFIASQIVRPQASRPAGGEPRLYIPALSMVIECRDPAVVAPTLDRVAANLLALLNVQPPKSGPLRMETIPIGPGGGSVSTVAVGQLLTGGPGAEFLSQLQLSWAVSDGVLVVGTASEAVRDILLAHRGQAPQLVQSPPSVRGGTVSQTVLLAQPAMIGDLVASWASFIQANRAQLIKTDLWTQLQTARSVSIYQLGIVPGRSEAGRMHVAQVLADLPAAGKLRAGDLLLAVDGRSLAQDSTPPGVDFLLAARSRNESVTFKLLRDGCEELIEVPIPAPVAAPRNFRPVDYLDPISRLLRLFAGARYSVGHPTGDTMTARLELQFAPHIVRAAR